MSETPILPGTISLEQQKKRARDLLSAHRLQQPEAAVRLREHLREFADLAPEAVFAAPLTLQLCQLVIAREHGYASWPSFKQAIEKQSSLQDSTAALRDAIDRDDGEVTYRLVIANPALLGEAVFDGGPVGYFANYRPRPLVYALQCGRVEAVKALLTASPAMAISPDAEGRYPIDLIFKPYGGWLAGARRVDLYHLLKSLGARPNLEAATAANDIGHVLTELERDPASVEYERPDFNWNLLVMAADGGAAEIVAAVLARQEPEEIHLGLAIDRAAFGGKLDVLKLLLPFATQRMKDVALCGCGESLSLETARLLLQHGANATAEDALTGVYGERPWSKLAVALTTYSRKPWRGEYIDLLVNAGARRVTPLADTTELDDIDGPVMAFFRGRFDLLEQHWNRDPSVVKRRFPLDEEWSVHTPITGGTLLHLAIEYLDRPMAEWLVQHGADVNARSLPAKGEPDGSGHTPLFQAVRASAILYGPAGGRETPEGLVAWLLEHGADPNLRATICSCSPLAEPCQGRPLRNLTPLGYLRAMSDREARRKMASNPVWKVLTAAGGRE